MTTRKLRFSLRFKFIVAFAVVALIVSAATTLGIYIQMSRQIMADFRRRAETIVAVAALQQNGDEFARITSDSDALYTKFLQQNLSIRRSDPQIAYVFTATKDENGLYFVVDAGDPGEENIAAFGERYTDPSPTLAESYDSLTAAVSDPDIYRDAYGTFLSAYAPIFNSNGQRVGVIGIDILADTIIAAQQQILLQSILMGLVAAAIGIAAGSAAGSLLAKPIGAINAGTRKMTAGELEHRLDIRTGDELEELGHSFNAMSAEIHSLVGGLEARVLERTEELTRRTGELEQLNETARQRSEKLRAITEVSRSITTVQDLDELLQRVVQLISKEFGYYHAGIFLREAGEFVVLKAASSPGGISLVQRGHRLRVGSEGIVGFVAASGRARIALDTGSDAVFFDNPDLPTTRSEIALPLAAGGVVFGVLDVQAEQAGAFGEEEFELLTILSDQVSTSIENARLYAETRKALGEAEAVYARYIRQQWSRVAAENRFSGFQFTGAEVIPMPKGERSARARGMRPQQAIPIKIREETIGQINLPGLGSGALSPDELEIAQAVAERVALAIENARLLNDAMRRASKEKVISEIAARLSSSVNLDNVLATAVEELGQVLPGAEIFIQFESDEDRKSAGENQS